jgi:hypothetical protein
LCVQKTWTRFCRAIWDQNTQADLANLFLRPSPKELTRELMGPTEPLVANTLRKLNILIHCNIRFSAGAAFRGQTDCDLLGAEVSAPVSSTAWRRRLKQSLQGTPISETGTCRLVRGVRGLVLTLRNATVRHVAPPQPAGEFTAHAFARVVSFLPAAPIRMLFCTRRLRVEFTA